jgi:hypothetical protein
MIFVFDNSPLSALFKNYYRSIFGGLWEGFDTLVEEGRLVSTREVLREIEDGPIESLRNWAGDNKEIFATPTAEQGSFVAEIYKVPHFQQNIETKKFFKGGRNADPFVIARAAVEGATVVTLEKATPNAAKIPNICGHFGVNCMNLEEFMEAEGWRF